MKIEHRWVDFVDRLMPIKATVVLRIERALFVVLFLGFAFTLYQIFFPKNQDIHLWVNHVLRQIPRLAMLLYLGKWVLETFIRKKIKLGDRNHLPDLSFFFILLIFNLLKHQTSILESEWFLYIILSLFFVIRLMREGAMLKTTLLNPSILFAVSFILLILAGTALLLIPKATNGDLSLIDALFTATSAVCVTGLATVDTATVYTEIGHDIILFLIQIGGLGLMTFTNFFAILFRGGMSFKNHLILSNLIESDQPDSLFSTLTKIVVYSFLVEIVGAVIIQMTYGSGLFPTTFSSWHFSVFHSISAFCNAGFSTIPDGLFNINFRFNYEFQIIIAILVILGGIGFPVVIDIYQSIKDIFTSLVRTIIYKERYSTQARHLNVHSKLVLSSTFILLVVGMFMYYITEYNNTLLNHTSTYGKWVQSFFGSVTPRTAGFNTVDMGSLMQGTILFYLLFMWIGASPSSTGGGIKTTTFTIALFNIFALSKGKNRVDLFRREIADTSISRAFAVIFLSLIIIGFAVFLISIFEPKHNLTEIAFECFSAYSTVGLSLNLTAQLGIASKLVLIVTMFLGRVGMFTLLFGLFRKEECKTFKYPKENILIA